MPREKMPVLLVILLVALLMVGFLPLASQTAFAVSTVHGNVYDWASFDTLKNAEIVVNSMPQQVMISKNGSYSFDLDKGMYTIKAESGANTTNALFAMENVTITQDGGDYVIDLVLFPSSDFEDLTLLDDNSTPIISVEPPDESTPQQSYGLIILIVLAVIVVVVGAAAFIYLRRRKKPSVAEKNIPEQAAIPELPSEPESPVEQDKEPPLPPLQPSASNDVTLPDDLREVIRIIEKNGGRITQLDLRKALPYSEAKVSLMITDLENRGIIKKIKKGRGNIIILNKPGNANPENE